MRKELNLKFALITFKTLQIGKPSYLSELLIRYDPSRDLRSASKNLLVIPYIRSSHGRRSFSFAAPTVWKSLTSELRLCNNLEEFRRLLKIHLFPP